MTYTVRDMPEQIAPALVAKYANVETATVGHRRHMGFMDRAIQCVLSSRRVAGTAVTLAQDVWGVLFRTAGAGEAAASPADGVRYSASAGAWSQWM